MNRRQGSLSRSGEIEKKIKATKNGKFSLVPEMGPSRLWRHAYDVTFTTSRCLCHIKVPEVLNCPCRRRYAVMPQYYVYVQMHYSKPGDGTKVASHCWHATLTLSPLSFKMLLIRSVLSYYRILHIGVVPTWRNCKNSIKLIIVLFHLSLATSGNVL